MKAYIKAISALLLGLSLAGPAAAECLTVPVDSEDLNQFVGRFSESLEAFKRAELKNASVIHAKDAAGFLVALKMAQQDLSCAAKLLEGFKGSSNKAVQTTVQAVQVASENLSTLDDIASRDFVSALNGKSAHQAPGDQASRLASMQMQSHDAWQLLITASQAAAFSLFEFDPSDPKRRRQALTSGQRASLTKHLLRSFPTIASKNGANTPQVDVAAAVLYDFVLSKRWHSHEQPFALVGD